MKTIREIIGEVYGNIRYGYNWYPILLFLQLVFCVIIMLITLTGQSQFLLPFIGFFIAGTIAAFIGLFIGEIIHEIISRIRRGSSEKTS